MLYSPPGSPLDGTTGEGMAEGGGVVVALPLSYTRGLIGGGAIVNMRPERGGGSISNYIVSPSPSVRPGCSILPRGHLLMVRRVKGWLPKGEASRLKGGSSG